VEFPPHGRRENDLAVGVPAHARRAVVAQRRQPLRLALAIERNGPQRWRGVLADADDRHAIGTRAAAAVVD
jgi:hypothetical protein